jgi:hypothetical protein
VTSQPTSATSHQKAPLARLLAFVLLAFVAYSTTVEAVHKHGALSLAANGVSATAIYSSGDTGTSANNSRSASECVICQLRQQLSTSLLSALPQTIAPQEQIARRHSAALPASLRFATPQRGRAPPLASLI